MNKMLLTLLFPVALAACQSVGERAAVAEKFPIYGNDGKPDLTVDPERLKSRMGIADREFAPGSCALREGSVGAPGIRRILYFDTVVMNAGDGDLVIGDFSDQNNLYGQLLEYASCHGHFHISDFSLYELLRADDRTTVVAGQKLGFCFRDNLQYSGGPSRGYGCGNQGITSGWGDLYDGQLDGQWIDITGVAEGDYIVRVTINAAGSFDEGRNLYPNVIEVPIRIPAPGGRLDAPLTASAR